MATNVEKTLTVLTKLYSSRTTLDKQILVAEKKLAATAIAGGPIKPKRTATKKVASVKKAVVKKVTPKL
jgi:hypothetical protein